MTAHRGWIETDVEMDRMKFIAPVCWRATSSDAKPSKREGTIIGRLERFHHTLNEEPIEGGPLRSPEYPDSRLVRRVNHRGIVSFQNTDVRVGRSVSGESVTFQVVDEDRWDVYDGRHYFLNVERRRGELRTTQRPPAQGDAERRPPSVSFGA